MMSVYKLILAVVCSIIVNNFLNPQVVWAFETVCFECHKKESFQDVFIHKPVQEGQCGSCHNMHAARHEGLLQKKGAEFCYSCHEDKNALFSKPGVHQPVQEGKCLVCHAAHTSKNKGLLRSFDKAEACFNCHDTMPKHFKFEHAPFSKGECSACHAPHGSENYSLLKKKNDDLCLSCHVREKLKNGHKSFPGELRECLTCHQPHGSERKGLIRNFIHEPFSKGCSECHAKSNENDMENCLRCHELITEQMYSSHSHMMGKAKNACTVCHSPHAADTKNLLKGKQKFICRNCHQERYDRFDANLSRHPDADNCVVCHNAHGSNHLAQLKYDGIMVCSNCHETQGQFSHPVGQDTIDQRTGQAMTCITCHYPHGTDYKFSLKFSGSKDLCIQCHRGY